MTFRNREAAIYDAARSEHVTLSHVVTGAPSQLHARSRRITKSQERQSHVESYWVLEGYTLNLLNDLADKTRRIPRENSSISLREGVEGT